MSRREFQLWAAVNEYAASCGGDTSSATISDRRMDAVAAVARIFLAEEDLRRELLAVATEAEAVLADLAAELCERYEYVSYFNRPNGHGLKLITRLRAILDKAKAGGTP